MENSERKGIGFTGMLQVAFIVLKLVGVIDWKWVWVLTPTWGYIALFIVIFGIVLLAEVIKKLIKKNKKKSGLDYWNGGRR